LVVVAFVVGVVKARSAAALAMAAVTAAAIRIWRPSMLAVAALGGESPAALGGASAPSPETPSDLRSPGRVFSETATDAPPATGVSGSSIADPSLAGTSAGGFGSFGGLGAGRCMPPMTGGTGAGRRVGAGVPSGAGGGVCLRRRRRGALPSSSIRIAAAPSPPIT
jgi:hypothetical protein